MFTSEYINIQICQTLQEALYELYVAIVVVKYCKMVDLIHFPLLLRWLGSRVVSVLDSVAEGPWFKSQPQRCRVTVLGKLFTPIVPVFTKQRNW